MVRRIDRNNQRIAWLKNRIPQLDDHSALSRRLSLELHMTIFDNHRAAAHLAYTFGPEKVLKLRANADHQYGPIK
jgi:hypothetical protein